MIYLQPCQASLKADVQLLFGLLTVFLEKHKQRREIMSFGQCVTWLPVNRISQHEEKVLFLLSSLPNYTSLLQTIELAVSQEGLQIAFIIKDVQKVHAEVTAVLVITLGCTWEVLHLKSKDILQFEFGALKTETFQYFSPHRNSYMPSFINSCVSAKRHSQTTIISLFQEEHC